MALNKKDKEDIGQIVKINVTQEIGLLRLEMNQRFDETDKKIDKNHTELLGKIDEIKQMETEDVRALTDDIVLIKKKIGFTISN